MANTDNELTGLFQVPQPRRYGFPAFAISTAVHGFGIAAVMWALLHTPAIVRDPLSKNYKVRNLRIQVPETAESLAADALYPNKNNPAKPAAKHDVSAKGTQQTAEAAPRPRGVPALRLPDGGRGKQILVQPEERNQLAKVEIALPSVLVWTPAAKPADTVVPPAPQPLATVEVHASLNAPNQEQQLADLPEVAADRKPLMETAPAGNTSPIATQGPSEAKTPPATAAAPSGNPAPAAILSASDIRMNNGTVALPPVNETRGDQSKAGAAAGQQGVQNAIGDPGHAESASSSTKDSSSSAKGTRASAAISEADQAAAAESAEHIELPKDGRFNVVVVGSSLSDQYPETLQVWSDRVAYTAYLHVGTPKAWILQYAQLREADASAGGTVAHLEAPWPYDILRPNMLAKDLNADALMVHGVLNEAGKLVNLAIAYPAGYVHGSYVLHELQQWQFRPAQQRGKPTAVEVLLIIPEEND
ncbi:hypothetical protein [Occallatibacter riparius]|uniref:TonB C-terminal domain-containing protein n=1 Tax=Occallatibacter riparius TaxID=1002689 RepID=A0A9J7BQ61_9BACT|nr:hypothetical protein [Occallatibacter riparius]UWZ83078.1 hypothetical protein MOP44_21215 [Occallatibacter riparius]